MVRHDFNQFRASACRNGILRPLENPKKQSDGGGSGGRLNPSRLLFRLAFLSWPLVPVRRIALFFKIPEFSGSYVDRVYISSGKTTMLTRRSWNGCCAT